MDCSLFTEPRSSGLIHQGQQMLPRLTEHQLFLQGSGKGNKEKLKFGGKFQIEYALELRVQQFSWNQRKNILWDIILIQVDKLQVFFHLITYAFLNMVLGNILIYVQALNTFSKLFKK